MPTVKFGRNDEPAVTFEKSEDLIAVRTRSNRSIMAGPVLSPLSTHLFDSQLVMAFPEVGVEVYKVPNQLPSVAERKEALRLSPDVRFAGGVLVDEASGEPVIYTENLFIKFKDEVDQEHCRAVIQKAGLIIKEAVTYATNAFFISAPEGTGLQIFDIALDLLKREDVEYCHPEIVRQRSFRAIAVQQWHLKTATINNTLINASANVEAAHQLTRGEGIIIAIIDDGIDIDHQEFNNMGKVVSPRDATQVTNDPRPKDDSPGQPDNHGTACAGVACADGRDGASGVAPGAKLLPIRMVSGLGSQREAEAFRWAADHGADVISCSWGPADGDWFRPDDPRHDRVVQLPANTRLAIDYATIQGRAGKGCVILFAAGNGNESVDNDGYASYERVIAVAACNDQGKRSVYSDFGKAVWCTFPSSDFGHAPFNHPEPLTPGIWTTDRTGFSGYNLGKIEMGDQNGNYTNSFGGTSSACPGAAGVAALVLSVNPELRWQQVKEILGQACDKIDPQGGSYNAQGQSNFYGFGRLNAEKAVTLAKPAFNNKVSIIRTFNRPLSDLQKIIVSVEISEEQPIESLSVQVEILHTFIGDLVITLVPPIGLPVILHNRVSGATNNLKKVFDPVTTPALAFFKDKKVKGKWTLEVEDKAIRDIGRLVRYGIDLILPAPDPRAITSSLVSRSTRKVKVTK